MHTPSKQKWLERNRAPRVQISYDVETAGAIEKRELPLVVGVFADLSGMPVTVVPVGERRFVEIDRDNFDDVMAKIAPRLDVGRLSKEGDAGAGLGGVIEFKKIDHFDPEYIVTKVPALNELFETRNELRDLMAKLDGNAKLEGRLSQFFVDDKGEAIAKEKFAVELEKLRAAPADAPAKPVVDTVAPAPAPAPAPDGTPDTPTQ